MTVEADPQQSLVKQQIADPSAVARDKWAVFW